MRTYRGLTKDGKWVYGWYAEVMNHHFIIPSEATWGLDLDLNEKTIARQIEVILSTVGQSTGARDINCKEIYQHDLTNHGAVAWNSKLYGWVLLANDEIDGEIKGVTKFLSEYRDDIEIIGNIHEQEQK